MAVISVERKQFVDKTPDDNGSYYARQGETYDSFYIYEITNDDGSKQNLKIVVPADSYGTNPGLGDVLLVEPKTKTVTVWE